MKTYLIGDPYHDYAARFIEHIHRTYGYRALCFHTNRMRRACEAGAYPILRSKAVLRHDEIHPSELGAWAKRMAERYEVLGLIAYGEETVEPAATISEALQLNWNTPEVLRRFRDKFALKEHLRQADPGLRINASMRVSLESFPAEIPFDRFVLKPNDGVAGANIGIFDRKTPRSEIDDYLRALEGRPLVMEEHIGGEEYFVNGQVDGNGDATVFWIGHYHRVEANGQPRVMFRIDLVHRDEAPFKALESYAIRMLRASGLRRSPFHLEAKVDEQGPCMIECGARLGGHAMAFVGNDAHGGALDAFAVAAHDYLHDAPQTVTLDWSVHEALDVRYVDAIASGERFVRGREGIAAVQSMPSFRRWAIKPKVGVSKLETRDCLSMPYSAVLFAPRGSDLERDETMVRRLMDQPAKGWSALYAQARTLGDRALRAVSWRSSLARLWVEEDLYPRMVHRLRGKPMAVPAPQAEPASTRLTTLASPP